jgi:teichuronic acid biosynthesis glycosyltransferase TuaH
LKRALGHWDDLVVVVGTSFWDGVPLLERHLAAELARYRPVLYVDPVTSVFSRFRNREARRMGGKPGLRKVSDSLCVLTMRVPPLHSRPFMVPLKKIAIWAALRGAHSALGKPRVAATILTSFEPFFGVLSEARRVYYVKDDYVAGASLIGTTPPRAARAHQQRLQEADIVVVVSEVLADLVRAAGVKCVFIPNGCSPDRFASIPPPPAETNEPRVAFVGQLSDRVDARLIRAVVDRGIPVRLIGAQQETLTAGSFDDLVAHPLVEWIGVVPHERVQEHLESVIVCILPYANSAFNRASFPLKLLEYLAAGRRVVSADLPAVRWLATDLVSIADTPDEFATTVTQALLRPLEEDEVAERRLFAARHSWRARADQLANLLELTVGAVRG